MAHYLNLLAQAGLVGGIEKFSGNKVREKASSPKLQVYNTALMGALETDPFDTIRNTPDRWGRYVESMIGAHFVSEISGKPIELYYWKDRNYEVDFVLTLGDRISAFEVKSGGKFRKVSGFMEFKRQYPKAKTYVISDSQGISLKDFFQTSIREWF